MFRSYRVLQAEHLATLRELAEARKQRDYWQTRAEKLIEHALARQGAIGQATMVDSVKPPQPPSATVLQAMSVKEFDEATR